MFGEGSQLPFIILMIVVFVFFIILPQRRRQKKEKNFLQSLSKGKKIITKSGLHGKISEVNEKDGTFIIETLSGKLKLEKTAISSELSAKLNSSDALQSK